MAAARGEDDLQRTADWRHSQSQPGIILIIMNNGWAAQEASMGHKKRGAADSSQIRGWLLSFDVVDWHSGVIPKVCTPYSVVSVPDKAQQQIAAINQR